MARAQTDVDVMCVSTEWEEGVIVCRSALCKQRAGIAQRVVCSVQCRTYRAAAPCTKSKARVQTQLLFTSVVKLHAAPKLLHSTAAECTTRYAGTFSVSVHQAYDTPCSAFDVRHESQCKQLQHLEHKKSLHTTHSTHRWEGSEEGYNEQSAERARLIGRLRWPVLTASRYPIIGQYVDAAPLSCDTTYS